MTTHASTTSRRGMLGGLALVAAGAATALPATAASLDRLTWDRRMAVWLRAKAAFDLIWDRFEAYDVDKRPSGLGEQVDAAMDAVGNARDKLFETPAPDATALKWKIDQLWGAEHRNDEYAEPWSYALIDFVIADALRLASA